MVTGAKVQKEEHIKRIKQVATYKESHEERKMKSNEYSKAKIELEEEGRKRRGRARVEKKRGSIR